MVNHLTVPQLVGAALLGGGLLVLGVARVMVWAIAAAMLGSRGDAAWFGSLLSGIVFGAIGMALLALAARLPASRGH